MIRSCRGNSVNDFTERFFIQGGMIIQQTSFMLVVVDKQFLYLLKPVYFINISLSLSVLEKIQKTFKLVRPVIVVFQV